MAYTTIDDPSAFFQTALYTGNGTAIGSGGLTVTNDGNSDLQPDWIWHKNYGAAESHAVADTNRGTHKGLFPDLEQAESTGGSQYVNSFNTDGFTVGNVGWANDSGQNYVAWQWKCNGGTTTTNDASATSVGTIDSVYQANTTAGFSIVTYTGTGSAGTIAHGVGATPHWVLVKNRSTGDRQWYNQHIGNSSASKGQTLSTNGAEQTLSAVFGDTRASSTVFTVGDNNSINDSGDNYVAYVFAPIQGYSKFGSYTGNGNADGAFVYTGFKPAWLMIKRIDSANHWLMFDIKRDINNVGEKWLRADTNDAASTGIYWDGLSNGFKARTNDPIINASGGTYIYMTFAEHPFVSSKGVPVTAR
jgi:hypothetical protein